MDTIPDNVRAAAAAAGLGAVKSRYRSEIELLMFYVSALGLVGLGFLLAGLFGDDTVDLVIGSGAVTLSLLGWYGVFRRAKGWLYLCEHGILLPRQRRSFRWEDVAHLQVWDTTWVDPTIGIFPSHVCVVELTDGYRIDLGELSGDAGWLSSKVEGTITKVVDERRLEELRTKGRTAFGPLSVTTTGMTAGSETAGWDDIAVVEIEPDWLRVRDGDRRVLMSQRLKRVRHLAELLRLLADHGVIIRRLPDGES